MKRKNAFVAAFLPTVAMVFSLGLTTPQTAEAQYRGGGYRGGGFGHRPRWGFRHRFHPYVGGQLGGSFVLAQVTDYADGYLSHGGGGGLFAGMRFGPFFSGEVNWNITFHDDSISDQSPFESLYLMTFTVDGKIHIPTYGPAEPYFQAGIGFCYIGAMYEGAYDTYDENLAKGPTFRLGGGLDYWLGPFFSIGGRILWEGLYFSEDAYGRETPGGSKSNFINLVSVNGNITFHF